jgi:hypothetical protein
MLKKNQGLVEKIKVKINKMIKPSRKDSRNSGTKGSLKRSQIKRRICHKYNASAIKNMVTTRIIVLS